MGEGLRVWRMKEYGDGFGGVKGGNGYAFSVLERVVPFLQDEGMVETDGFWERWVCAQ